MTTTPDIEFLRQHDWHAYACQCTQHRHKPCPNRATHIVEIHALHNCNEPGLNTYGNRVELRCFECLGKLCVEVARKLSGLSQFGPAECSSCGAPIASVNHVVRGAAHL